MIACSSVNSSLYLWYVRSSTGAPARFVHWTWFFGRKL